MQEKKPKGLIHLAAVPALSRALGLALFVTACALDLSGRVAGSRFLWVLGAHAAEIAMLMWLAGWWVRPRRTGVSWYITLLAFGLARFLRGTAAVPPDPPLIMLQAIGIGTALRFWWKSKRFSLQSRLEVQR